MVRFCPQLEVIEYKRPVDGRPPTYYVDTGCLLAEIIFHPYNVKLTGKPEKGHYNYVASPICRCVSCPFNAPGCIASKGELFGNITQSRIRNLHKIIEQGKMPTVFEEPEMPLYPEKAKINTQYKAGDICPHCGERTHSRLKAGEDEHGPFVFCMPCGFYFDQTDKIGLIAEPSPVANGFVKMLYGGQGEC